MLRPGSGERMGGCGADAGSTSSDEDGTVGLKGRGEGGIGFGVVDRGVTHFRG